jgi:hypothetical protein
LDSSCPEKKGSYLLTNGADPLPEKLPIVQPFRKFPAIEKKEYR